MIASEPSPDDLFEILLRRQITESVIGGTDHGQHLITRLRRFDLRARSEQLSSQTLQVIASARRLLGDEPASGRTVHGRRRAQ
jgi:hypothetical protein